MPIINRHTSCSRLCSNRSGKGTLYRVQIKCTTLRVSFSDILLVPSSVQIFIRLITAWWSKDIFFFLVGRKSAKEDELRTNTKHTTEADSWSYSIWLVNARFTTCMPLPKIRSHNCHKWLLCTDTWISLRVPSMLRFSRERHYFVLHMKQDISSIERVNDLFF